MYARVEEDYKTWTDLSGNAFPTGNSVTLTGLNEGARYKLRVRARYQSGGSGDWSHPIVISYLDSENGFNRQIMLFVALSISDGQGFQNFTHMAESILARCLCYRCFIDEVAYVDVAHIINTDFTAIRESAPRAEGAIINATRSRRKTVRYDGPGSMKKRLLAS